MVRTIAGCENAEIMRPAYAVEYDFALSNANFIRRFETKSLSQSVFSWQIVGRPAMRKPEPGV